MRGSINMRLAQTFEAKTKRLTATLQQRETAKLDDAIAENLRELGYGE
ncbi:MAG: hypothetical protein ACYDHO_03380 [Gaiellaceae bacterium]